MFILVYLVSLIKYDFTLCIGISVVVVWAEMIEVQVKGVLSLRKSEGVAPVFRF